MSAGKALERWKGGACTAKYRESSAPLLRRYSAVFASARSTKPPRWGAAARIAEKARR
jgi:hypothetical protein